MTGHSDETRATMAMKVSPRLESYKVDYDDDGSESSIGGQQSYSR